MENVTTCHSLTTGSGEEEELKDETTSNGISGVENGVEMHEEVQEEVLEKEEEQKETGDAGEGDRISPDPSSEVFLSISSEEQEENGSRTEILTETPTNPDLLHPVQRCQSPVKGSHLTRRDKLIIEKIRSYYEAAAKAEEDEAEEEDDEQGEGVASRRRSSFSQIPSGLVKESVSRFDGGGNQVELESEQPIYQTTTADDGESEPLPIRDSNPSPAPISAGQAEKPVSPLDFNAEDLVSVVTQDQETTNQAGSIEQVAELQERINPPEGGMEDKEVVKPCTVVIGQEEEPSITNQYQCREESIETSRGNPTPTNRHEPNQVPVTESNRSHEEPSREPVPQAEQCPNPDTQIQSSWTRKKHRELPKTDRNVDCPATEVGRWSHHSRIVTANRTLFEAMGSDVAGIGLFEASPVVDSVLMENSERILTKVQTLAQMYSAKASTIKVSLRQKRASTSKASVASARLSGLSSQIQTKSQKQVQTHTGPAFHLEGQKGYKQSDTGTENKYGRQYNAEVQSHTTKPIMQQSLVQTQMQMQRQHQLQNQPETHSQSQVEVINWDQTIYEKNKIKRSESLTNGKLCFFLSL